MKISCFIGLSTDIIFRRSSPRFFNLWAYTCNALLFRRSIILANCVTDMGMGNSKTKKLHSNVLMSQTVKEYDVEKFLQTKGASKETITSIIRRYPRSITRSYQSLEERWNIWKNILSTDLEILAVLKRSPESFFRSENNNNMQKNITFFYSLGLTSSDLSKMLTRTPRIFSNSVDLNTKMVEFLHETCLALGGKNPNDFVKQSISKNGFTFLRSVKQVKANVQFLQSSFSLDDKQLLALLHTQGRDILDLSHEYLKKTFANIKKIMLSHGCTEIEVNTMILKHLDILYLSTQNLNKKIDIILQANISIQQILKTPSVLDKSINIISQRIAILEKLNYNFEISGIRIIELSQQRFEAKLKRLQAHNEQNTEERKN